MNHEKVTNAIEPEKDKLSSIQVTKVIAEDKIESNTEPTTNPLKADTIIISPLRDIDIKKITNIQEAIETFDNTMKETRQKPHKLHLTHLEIQRKT